MTAIANFKDQITDLCVSIPAAISDAGEKFFDDGILDVINRFAKTEPQKLALFTKSTAFNQETGYALNNIKIFNVVLDNGVADVVCRKVSNKLKSKVLEDSGSIHEATWNSPAYYIEEGTLYACPRADFDVTISDGGETIKVAFGSGGEVYAAKGAAIAIGDIFEVQGVGDFSGGDLATAKGSAPAADDLFYVTAIGTNEAVTFIDGSKVTEVVKGVVTNYASGTSSIANFPDNYYYLPILYTAIMILLVKIATLAGNAGVSSAFTSADNYMDNLSTHDFEDWIADEDAEMAAVAVGGAQQRISEARGRLEDVKSELVIMQNQAGVLRQQYLEAFVPFKAPAQER